MVFIIPATEKAMALCQVIIKCRNQPEIVNRPYLTDQDGPNIPDYRKRLDRRSKRANIRCNYIDRSEPPRGDPEVWPGILYSSGMSYASGRLYVLPNGRELYAQTPANQPIQNSGHGTSRGGQSSSQGLSQAAVQTPVLRPSSEDTPNQDSGLGTASGMQSSSQSLSQTPDQTPGLGPSPATGPMTGSKGSPLLERTQARSSNQGPQQGAVSASTSQLGSSMLGSANLGGQSSTQGKFSWSQLLGLNSIGKTWSQLLFQ